MDVDIFRLVTTPSRHTCLELPSANYVSLGKSLIESINGDMDDVMEDSNVVVGHLWSTIY